MKRTMLLTSLAVSLLLAMPLTALSVTTEVSTAAELQAALTAAESNGKPDTIILKPGVYDTDDNPLMWADPNNPYACNPGPAMVIAPFLYMPVATELYPLTIKGKKGKEATTILDGNMARQVMYINNMVFRGNDEDELGEGTGDVARPQDCWPASCPPPMGTSATCPIVAAIDDSAATVTVKNLTFRNGYSPIWDTTGGLAIETYRGDITVKNCDFLANVGGEGGGLLAFSFQGDVLSENNFFSGNVLEDNGEDGGGGVLISGRGDPEDKNEPGDWGSGGDGSDEGPKPDDTGTVTVKNNTVTNNFHKVGNYGGGGGLAVMTSSGKAKVTKSGFYSNKALDDGDRAVGGGLYAHSFEGEVLVKKSEFFGNASGYDGGGANVWSKEGNVSIKKSKFKANYGINEDDADGGGLMVKAGGGSKIKNNKFQYNVGNGEGGGGAHVGTYGSMAGDVDDTMDDSNNRLGGGSLISGNLFEGNQAVGEYDDGGGLHARAYDSNDLEVFENKFKNNTAYGSSGGGAKLVNATGDTFLEDNSFTNNAVLAFQGVDGGAAYGGGGVSIDTESGAALVKKNVIKYNFATMLPGGGLAVNLGDDASVDFKSNEVVSNTAGTDGQDVYVDDIDEDTIGDVAGSEIRRKSNNTWGDFYSLCANTAGPPACVPDITDY